MNKITKILIFACVALTLGYFYSKNVDAARNFMVNNVISKGFTSEMVPHPGLDPKSYARFSSMTEALICTGHCLIYDVILTSGTAGADYAIIRDTTAVNGSGAEIVAKLTAGTNGAPVSLAAGNPNAFPIMTTLGITADLSTAGSNELLIIYKDMD